MTTPFEAMGWKKTDKFRVIHFKNERRFDNETTIGDVVSLRRDDGTINPHFNNESSGYTACIHLQHLHRVESTGDIPHGAVAYIVPTGGIGDRKPFYAKTLRNTGESSVGVKVDGVDFHVLHEYWSIEVLPPREWTGEGLPPVGTVCDYASGGSWSPCTIIARSDDYIIIKVSSGEVVLYTRDFNFRPTRSERDKATEEMMMASGCSPVSAGIIYDAGYRKV